MDKLALIAPENMGSQKYYGYHRDIIYDIVFGGGIALDQMFDLLNDSQLTLAQAEEFFKEHYKDNDKIVLNGSDIYVLNRYINDYIRVPLLYDKKSIQPVNNVVTDYLVDFLVEVKGWAKVQDRIYTAEPESYCRFFDYASKGYYIQLKPYALKYDFTLDEFITIDNNRRVYRYSEDKEICDRMAMSLSSARTELFRDMIIRDTERKTIKNDEKAKTNNQQILIDSNLIEEEACAEGAKNAISAKVSKTPEQ